MNTRINKSDIYLIVIYFIVDFSIQGRSYYKNNSRLIEYLLDFPMEFITTCAIIFIFTFWIIPKFLQEKRYLFFTVVGIGTMVALTSLEYIVSYWTGNNDWSKFPSGFEFVFKMINRCTSNVSFLFALFLTKKFYEGQNQLIEVEKQQKENELKLLRSQLDPHFLFNNLNTLDSLIDSNSEKAKEYINRLSLIYRYLIQTKDSEVMELSEEITLAENYIFLIKTRFDHDYDFHIKRNASIENKFIPTGAIQALLENVVKHNKPSVGNTITATIYIEDNWLTVANSKSSIVAKKDSFGTGLENLKTRYQLLSDKEISIINTNNEFKVIIPIIKLSVEN
ncbi:sensor histidine kinase [Tenacibaculum amylolyticum]|uniref:sensor histidine kinase n=1 Tax=Tenacibaculum amylolyticum TaxID=104269 RepID=UPI0038954AAE